MSPPAEPPGPFLKWAGGKRQLLPELRRYYPASFNAYIEPFVGSGAVFFDLAARGRLAARPVLLADTNADVVGCYQALRREPDAVIAALGALAREHDRRGVAFYYEVRDGRFNPGRLARTGGARRGYPAELAAMLIYLNRTGFNGLFRLNTQGVFNVPAGRYERPRICDHENLRAVARVLAQPGVRVRQQSFERVLAQAAPGDFLYFDPPYAPVSTTASFTAYTSGGFGEEDQRELQRVIVALAGRGCQVLLSNSTAPLVRELYAEAPEARAAGLSVRTVLARRAINSRASARGTVREYLITNIPRLQRVM